MFGFFGKGKKDDKNPNEKINEENDNNIKR